MRPVAGAPPPAPPRKASLDTSGSLPNNGPTTSFFVASESEVEGREDHQEPVMSQEQGDSIADSTYGVRSLDEGDGHDGMATLRPLRRHTAIKDGEEEPQRSPDALRNESPVRNNRRDQPTDSIYQHFAYDSSSSSPAKEAPKQRYSLETLSQPLTPVSFASPLLGSSAPSSPKSMSMRSFRPSSDDEFEAGSQAIATSSEDEAEPQTARIPTTLEPAAQQQLIMPSITMPSRRPFTPSGKSMGRIKVLVAGATGTGKTSLIKSIVQTCEDVVHVDALPTQTPRLANSRYRNKGTTKVAEIYASTKAYPPWWVEPGVEEDVQRRNSTGENVLERNLCFVDTPGFDRGTSMLEGMEPTLQYLQRQVTKSLNGASWTDSEMLAFLGGSGGAHVDVTLYLINHDLKPADLEFIRQLNNLTNVIPLLTKADLLDVSEIAELKCSIVATLSAASITPLDLPSVSGNPPTPPLTVCSCPPNELEAMDASVLMKSEYIQPLHPSDLSYLVSSLFEPQTLAYLKHTSARKLLAWRSSPARASQLPHPASTSIASSTLGPAVTDSRSSLATGQSSALTLMQASARLSTHQALEERRAQLRLASWAGSLQRSLANERRRYEALAQKERRGWLKERLEECEGIELGSDALGSGEGVAKKYNELVSTRQSRVTSRPDLARMADMATADPLGLVGLSDQLRQRGWVVVQVAGGCGVLGALAVWALGRWSEGWTLWWGEDESWFGLVRGGGRC